MASSRISYVIAARDAERTICATLASIGAQSLEDWDAVVVDDGSRDGTAAAVGAWPDARVRLERLAGSGVAAARERGLAGARSDLVCFLDADDLVEPGHAKALIGAMEPGTDAACCGYRLIGAEGGDLGYAHAPRRQELALGALVLGNAVVLGTAAVRRDALLRVLAADGVLFERRCGVEDWSLWLRLAAHGIRWAEPVPAPLHGYRQHGRGRSLDLVGNARDGVALAAKWARSAGEASEAARRCVTRALARAVVREDAAASATLLGLLEGGVEPAVFAAALRWSVAAEREARAWAADRLARAVSVTAGVSGSMALTAARAAVLDGGAWDEVARRACETAHGRGVLLYGAGRNGVRLYRALAARTARVVYADDAASAGRELPAERRVDLGEVDPAGWLAVATPDCAEAMTARLRTLGFRDATTAGGLLSPGSG